MSRTVVRQALCALFSLMLAASSAPAQPADAKALLAAMASRQAAMASLQSLERMAARIVYIESAAILSLHGDWPEEQLNWVVDVPKFVYDVNNIYGRFQPELAALRRDADRSRSFTDAEYTRFTGMLADLDLLIEESQTLYDLLADGRTNEANEFFRDSVRRPYQNIVEGSYSLGTGISKDIGKLALKARLLE